MRAERVRLKGDAPYAGVIGIIVAVAMVRPPERWDLIRLGGRLSGVRGRGNWRSDLIRIPVVQMAVLAGHVELLTVFEESLGVMVVRGGIQRRRRFAQPADVLHPGRAICREH